MKIINNKQFIEVVAAQSVTGIITHDELQIMMWMHTGMIRKFIDKGYARMFASMSAVPLWNILSKSNVLMYYCESDGVMISALDIVYTYLLNDKPTTAYELINLAQNTVSIDITDTREAAIRLIHAGNTVEFNVNLTHKYKLTCNQKIITDL